MTPACADNKLVMLRVIPSPSLTAAVAAAPSSFFSPLPLFRDFRDNEM